MQDRAGGGYKVKSLSVIIKRKGNCINIFDDGTPSFFRKKQLKCRYNLCTCSFLMQDITNSGGIIGFICVLSDYTIKRSIIHVYRISVRDSLLSLRQGKMSKYFFLLRQAKGRITSVYPALN